MLNFEVTQLVLIVISVCITVIFAMLIFRTKNGLKVKIDKSGIELDLTKTEPESEELKNETNTV
jgi:hypothetical protein